jgi:hypothetical protein
MTSGQADRMHQAASWSRWPSEVVRIVIAPLVMGFSGFVTADFIVSGVYSWPRTSRILILTLTVSVLAYEFVCKEHRAPYKALLYSCMIPYAVGTLVVLTLLRIL